MIKPNTPTVIDDQTLTDSQAAGGVTEGDCLKVEALLLTVDRPATANQIGQVVGLDDARLVKAAIRQLNEAYQQTGRSFRIENVAGGWQIITLPQYGQVVAALQRDRQAARLGPAAMETLAIVAYKQPVLRAEVETIRGVASGEVIRGLIERRLVKIVGRAEELGRPLLYGTTKTFLEVFGLSSLKDLPDPERSGGL